MKVSYTLLNKTGKARKIPPGQAWQWTYHLEDASELQDVLKHLKREIRHNRLALANLRFDRHSIDEQTPNEIKFAYKGPIIYDIDIHPQRIINCHVVDAMHSGTENA